MAIKESVQGPEQAENKIKETRRHPPSSIRFDWYFTLTATWLVGGIHLDGWAHNHIPTLETFFTPWHAVLYSGWASVGIFLLVNLIRNHARGYPWTRALPPGYNVSFVGAALFGIGGVLDLTWHLIFGIEHSIDALLSPTHLILASSLFLMVTGPLRAAMIRLPRTALTWAAGAPAIISLAFAMSVLAFFTQFVHPFVDDWAGSDNAPVIPKSSLWIVNADGTGQVRLTNGQMNVFAPVWSPNDKLIAFDGTSLGSGQSKSLRIYIIGSNGAGLKQATSGSLNSFHPAWNPASTTLAYAAGSPGNSEIFAVNGHSGTIPLTSGAGDHWFPAWAPNGKSIAYAAGVPGNMSIYVMQIGGTSAKQLTPGGSSDVSPTWSPAGRSIAFAEERNGHISIYEMRANGAGLKQLPTSSIPGWAPSFARYGIAFAQATSGSAPTYALLPTGTNFAAGSNGAGSQAYSNDGKKIAYVAAPSTSGTQVDYQSEKARGLASILLYAAILMGVLLLLIRRWRPPFGAVTLILTVTTGLISVMAYQFQWIGLAIVVGLIADGLIHVLRPSPARTLQFRAFGFAVPVILYLFYFLGTLIRFGGIWWTIHMWLGVCFMAGVIGLLLSYLAIPPQLVQEPAES